MSVHITTPRGAEYLLNLDEQATKVTDKGEIISELEKVQLQ